MRAFSAKGDVNEALQVYRKFADFLATDPKAAPDEQTNALYESLRAEQGRPGRIRAHARSTSPRPPSVQGSLPHATTALVGREDDVLEVVSELRRSRLVTLTGVGGIGKTRLAAQVAHESVRGYAHGVRLVPLESLSDPALTVRHIATGLGLDDDQNRTPIQSVVDHLREKSALLVLDNCEHLADEVARVAAHLLQHCPRLRILATSRAVLGVAGELVWAVPSLGVPEPDRMPKDHAGSAAILADCDSVRLFEIRAQALSKEFALTDDNALTVGQVCQRLEGIPLAIELAAAWLPSMTLREIASHLDDQLSLDIQGNETAPRQRTLRATLDRSTALLSEPERCLLRRLSVFAGGCDLATAERVCCGEAIEATDVLQLLTSLVDKSLAVFEKREATVGRYRLLEMVRQYAEAGLQECGETTLVGARHAEWFLAVAEVAGPKLKGAEQTLWLQRLELDHDNLRSALRFCEGDVSGAQKGLTLAGASYAFWSKRGDFDEGLALLTRALGRQDAQAPTAERARALNGAARRDYSTARRLFEESLSIRRELGDQHGMARTLNSLGSAMFGVGDLVAARAVYREALDVGRQSDQKGTIAESLAHLGAMHSTTGEWDTAWELSQEALALVRELGDRWLESHVLTVLSLVACCRCEYDEARRLYEESLVIHRESGNQERVGRTIAFIGHLEKQVGNYERAGDLYREALLAFKSAEDSVAMAYALDYLASLASHQGQAERAAQLAGAAETLAPAQQRPISQKYPPQYDMTVDAARQALGEAGFVRRWEAGRAMQREQAIALALEVPSAENRSS